MKKIIYLKRKTSKILFKIPVVIESYMIQINSDACSSELFFKTSRGNWKPALNLKHEGNIDT